MIYLLAGSSGDRFEDLVGALGPDVGPGIVVSGLDPGTYVAVELADGDARRGVDSWWSVRRTSARRGSATSLGRHEVHVEARINEQFGPHRRGIVRRGVARLSYGLNSVYARDVHDRPSPRHIDWAPPARSFFTSYGLLRPPWRSRGCRGGSAQVSGSHLVTRYTILK